MLSLFWVLTLSAEKEDIAWLSYFRIFPKTLVEVSPVLLLGFFIFSCVPIITFASHLFHFCLKSSAPLYSVGWREAAMAPCGSDSTGSKFSTDVEV